jgi:vancomycin resistance protein YoaR
MTTTDSDGNTPTAEPADRPDAGSPNGAATATPDGATPGPVEGSGPGEAADGAAGAGTAPAAGHDPVTDAATVEMPAVPAGVPGLDGAPAGPGAAGTGGSGTEPGPAATDTSRATSPSDSTPAGTPAAGDAAGSAPGPGSPPSAPGSTGAPDAPAPVADPAVTSEMPRIDAPAPAPSSGDSRPVYEVRAAAVKADPPAKAPTDSAATAGSPSTTPPAAGPPAPEAPVAEPPVTEPIPTVADRPSPVRDEPTRVVLGGDERPRHFRVGPARPVNTGEIDKIEDGPERRRSRVTLVAILAPVVVLMLLIVAWAADTASLSGQVQRNVELAGRQIGGKGEEALPEIMADVAAEQAERDVTIELEGREPYQATAAELGLVLDEGATTEAVLDTGRGDTVFVRPLKWLKSFFSPREVQLRYAVTETQTAATLQLLQGSDRTAATDPTIQLTDGAFVMNPGREGQGIDVSQVASDLREGARASTDGPITIEASAQPVQPQFSDEEAQQLADRANGLTADGITLKAGDASVGVPVPQLRAWITPAVVDGRLDLNFDAEKATAELPGLFADLDAEPENASMTLEGGVPKVVPATNGLTCCAEGSADLIWQGVQQEKGEVALEPVVTEPEITTAEVESWGIKEPVGGSRGFQSGADIAGPAPGFTTFHGCCEPRVTNIQRIADLVRGTVIPPGGTFSVNDTVGRRTREKGFVEAGAISEGIHVPEVGGGISQFATTTFNAAYFAGLDIETYQAHSEWFRRYPPGREATMGYPNPDLAIRNDTPYGVMVWTSYTDTSLTVTMYSTQHATAEQTGSSESMSGNCRVVTTTRTRSFPDGSTDTDTFRATYRPGEGLFC